MANIIVCYKWVVDEADLKFKPTDLSLDLSKAKSKLSEYDRNAIEEAVRIGKAGGDTVVTLTFGNSNAKQSIKDVLSRGPEKAYWVNDQLADIADGFVTAEVIAAAIRKISDYKLILCAEGASDTYARQIGPRIGVILDIPVISCVGQLKLEGNTITAKRYLEDATEEIKVDGPAVVCVLPSINTPPIPSLKQAVEALKKPVFELKLSDIELMEDSLIPRREVMTLTAYNMERKNIIIQEGSTSDKVRELVASLRKEGVI